MKRLIKYMVVVIVLFSVVALMTGCCGYELIEGKVTGGGWFINKICGPAYDAKCTFGFNAQGEGCLCDGINVKGQFQFNDHDSTILHCSVGDLYQVGPNTYRFEGVDKKSEKDIVVTVTDNGKPGADPGDYITVECDGDVWEGVLEGGNIVIH